MKVIRDPENWERTGLYRLAIRDRDCRHSVWTQAGSDAQSVGSAGPGLPPLAASAGEKKKGLCILFRPHQHLVGHS